MFWNWYVCVAKALLSCVFVNVISSAWHHRSPITAPRQQWPLRCRLLVLPGLPLPCLDVYICSEGNFQSKKSPKFQQTRRKIQGNGNSCYKSSRSSVFLTSQLWAVSVRVKPAGSEPPWKARPIPPLQAAVSKHSSQFKSKRSRSFRLDLQEIRWLMEVD